MKQKLICIICPRGCILEAEVEDHHVRVTGHSCPRGEAYAVNECLNPVRTVTATVRVSNRRDTMVSVKTENPVPKDRMMEVMAKLRRMTVEAPVNIGDVILPDACGSRIIATKAVL